MDLAKLLLILPKWIFVFLAVVISLTIIHAVKFADSHYELFGLGFGPDDLLKNHCVIVKLEDNCPENFDKSVGLTDFKHTHKGLNEHKHGIRIDGVNRLGGTSECTLDIEGSGSNIDCTNWKSGTGFTQSSGTGLLEEGKGKPWKVCCNY